METFKEVNIENIIIRGRRDIAIAITQIDCDYFMVLKGEVDQLSTFTCSVDNQRILAYYRTIARTSWILVRTISIVQKEVQTYAVSTGVIIEFSRIVFIFGTTRFPQTGIEPVESEICY